ncbi:MAG TPA: AzlD domain-containing protein [Paracoccaceae bacterium]|nr:AzlD domain-containing protein [Paracoccaceae bacterium]
MIDLPPTQLWAIILVLAAGTYLIRLSFLAFAGAAARLPEWTLRLLRYVPVTVLPALVAPMVVWPKATEGETDPVRLAAALAALGVGALTRSLFWAIAAGFAALFGLPELAALVAALPPGR